MEEPLEIGSALGHYLIRERLGSGGMGFVYRARDTKLGRDVALKVLSRVVSDDSEGLVRFEREAKTLAALNHPNVVTVYSVEEESSHHFITMELVQGHTLADIVSGKRLSLARIVDLATGLVGAVAAAHEQGIIHRDLKPNNVMLSRSGEVKVLDFGLAKSRIPAPAETTRATITQQGTLLGTVPYMSPEQLVGGKLDARSDVFSLGLVLYELATGRHPFESENEASVISSILRDDPPPLTDRRGDVPWHLDRIVGRCLEKVPDDRYLSAVELARDLADLSHQVGAPRPAERVLSAFGWGSRELRWMGTAAGVVLVVTLGVALQRFNSSGGGSIPQSKHQQMEAAPVGRASAASEIKGSTSRAVSQQSQDIVPESAVNSEPEGSTSRSQVPLESSSTPVEAQPGTVGVRGSPQPVPAKAPAGPGISAAGGGESGSDMQATEAAEPGSAPLRHTVQAALYRRGAAGRERLLTGSRVSLGDELFLTFKGSRSLYVYVLNEDDVGEIYILFPVQASDLQNPLRAGETHRLPGSRVNKLLNWQISTVAGEESLLVIASPTRLEALEVVLADVPEAQEHALTYVRVPAPVVGRLRGIGGLVETNEEGEFLSSEGLFARVQTVIDGEESFQGVWIRRIDLRSPAPKEE